tara:strand:- start:194 stop:1027 length:834 start_codon:yes stop_codon:yes gene_type:complete
MTLKYLRYLLIWVSFPACLLAQEQDLFNFSNSLEYAQFLDQKGNHRLAILEWERINMMKPGVDSLQLSLLRSYRLSHNWEQGERRFYDLFPGEARFQCSEEISREMALLLFMQSDFNSLGNYLTSHQVLSRDYVQPIQVSLALRNDDIEGAQKLYQDFNLQDARLSALMDKHQQLGYKSKGLALAMSTVVPGLGKAYVGNWKDGLVSLLFIGGSAFASYRGFKQNGVSSAYGWIFGTVSTGFYLGNLFGTAKAVNKYNTGVFNHYRADVENYIYHRL